MRTVLKFLQLLEEIFPYVGLPTDFKGAHSILLTKNHPISVDILVWHLGRAWPVTATMDEFEKVNEQGVVLGPKDDAELRAVVMKMKSQIELLASEKLSRV